MYVEVDIVKKKNGQMSRRERSSERISGCKRVVMTCGEIQERHHFKLYSAKL